MLLPICNKFVSLFVCSLLPSATLLCNGSPITPSFPRLSLRYQRWSLSSAMRFVMFSLLSPCGYHPLWHQKTPFSKSYRFAKKKTSDFSKKTQMNEKKMQKDSDKCWDSRLYHSVTMSNRRFPMERSPQLNIFHVAILTHWGHTGLVEHQHLVGKTPLRDLGAKFGDRHLVEIQ